MPKIFWDVLHSKLSTYSVIIRLESLSCGRAYRHIPTMAAQMMGSVGVRQAAIAKSETKERPGKIAVIKPTSDD